MNLKQVSSIARASAALASAAFLVVLLLGCPNPADLVKSGSLTVSIGDHVTARTLLPGVSMVVASFTVNGSGPNGASFSASTSSGSATFTSLAFGTWSVTVNAFNPDGTLIGQGSGSAVVQTGQTTPLVITVTPLAGNGTLTVSVSWPQEQVQHPAISAFLFRLSALRHPFHSASQARPAASPAPPSPPGTRR